MKRSTLLRYGVATLAVALVLLLKLLLDPLITDQSPFLLLAGAVMVAAWFGGLGPGLLATALGALAADYFFLPPVGTFTGLGLEFLPVFLFSLQGLLISSLAEALRAARGRAEASALEAQRHQESLRQSEERFRLLIEGVEDYAIFMLDSEGRIATWNAGAKRINGYDEDEIIGKHLSVFYTEEDVRRGHPEEELRVATSEGRYQEEGLRIRKDGSRFWASVLIAALRDEEGNLRGFSKLTRDITERKEAEEALKENEQRFRALVQNSSDVITVIDAEGTIRYVSPAVERVTGYHPEELVGKSVYYYVDPENLQEAQTMFSELWSQHGVHPPFEFKVPHKDGSWRESEFLVNNLLDDPSVRSVVVNQRDVTERKEAENKLRESEELYRSVVEQAAENIFLVDAESKRVLEANAALSRSLGYAPEELKEMTLYDIVAHDRESIDKNIWRILKDGRKSLGQRKYRRKDGSLVTVEVNVSVVRYGGEHAMCIVAHDVTERQQAEQELHRNVSVLLALREAGQVLGSTLESEEIATRLLEIMQGVAELTAAVISKRDGQEDLHIWRSVGLEALWPKIRFRPAAQNARLAALEHQEQHLLWLPRPGFADESVAALYLPLKVKDRIVGVLEAYGSEALVQDDTVEVLISLTNQAASALENAQLYEELGDRERALQSLVGKLLGTQEEERRRVAYEVHDGLAQVASAAHQHLQAFTRRYSPDAEKGQQDLARIVRLVRATVSDARRIIANLRPTTLDDLGLAATISLEVERLGEEGYQVDYEENLGSERLPDTVEIALFRIAQEALTNVRKHARTRRVRIELRRLEQGVRLEVRDFGRGFDQTAQPLESGPGERVGLAGMRERVGMLGGGLEINSRVGAGTAVVATVPVPRAAQAQ